MHVEDVTLWALGEIEMVVTGDLIFDNQRDRKAPRSSGSSEVGRSSGVVSNDSRGSSSCTNMNA